MNWLWIGAVLILAIGAVAGFAKGALKIAVSLAATLFPFVVVFIATPYVSQALASLTPLDEMIGEQCLDTMSRMAFGDSGQGTQLTEEQVRSFLAGAGVSEETLNAAGITVEDIVNGTVTGEDLEQYGISSGILDGQGHLEEGTAQTILGADVPKQTQISAIENSDLPDFFKDLLLSNNNEEVYNRLGVSTFGEYISTYVSTLILNIISFLITFLVVTIVVRAVVFALDFVNRLPVLGILNRLAGVGVGVVIAAIVLDFVLLGVTLLYPTSVGENMMGMVQESRLLTFLYDHNFVMNLATMFRG